MLRAEGRMFSPTPSGWAIDLAPLQAAPGLLIDCRALTHFEYTALKLLGEAQQKLAPVRKRRSGSQAWNPSVSKWSSDRGSAKPSAASACISICRRPWTSISRGTANEQEVPRLQEGRPPGIDTGVRRTGHAQTQGLRQGAGTAARRAGHSCSNGSSTRASRSASSSRAATAPARAARSRRSPSA